MSEMNGNKSRFGRTRKESIRRRAGIREICLKLESKTSGAAVVESESRKKTTSCP
jgi:hypothetical protein